MEEPAHTDIKTRPSPQAGFESNLSQNHEEILSKIKWQLEFTQKKHNDPFNKQTIEKQLDGLLRGDFAERLSLQFEPQQCRTVYNPTNIELSQYHIASFESLTDQKTKAGILAFAVRKSFKDSPPKNLTTYLDSITDNDDRKEALMDQITNEIVEGYSSKGTETNSGIFFRDTVIPDATLVNSKDEIAGVVEVKAYFPEELHRLVVRLNNDAESGKQLKTHADIGVSGSTPSKLNLGIDLNREIEFIDILRSVGFGLKELDVTMPALIRFPSDIPDDLIINYGDILTRCGYSVVLQKIPITTTELTKRAKEFVRNNLELITNKAHKGMTFSDRERKVLEDYSK